jgi:hypothetical protein
MFSSVYYIDEIILAANTYFTSAPLILVLCSLFIIQVPFLYMTIDTVNQWFNFNCDSFLPSVLMKTKTKK